ncbi:M15 family metallopeptidase [Alteribacillus sp. JSM 102045]|uniref:M15 family metallopeptidase n=1 Tax=Alteribacillus sp. JSM 102045 TaxID=1562101 RepID=UPI0035C045A8
MAKELGFEWGGDWPGLRDYSHLQLDTDLVFDNFKCSLMLIINNSNKCKKPLK